MYLLVSKIKIKMKQYFSTFECKILYLIVLIVCKTNLPQSDHMDCKIIIIEGEETIFLVGCSNCFQCFKIQ
jgi:hypothetical protein